RRPEGATSTPDAVEEASLSPSISPSRTALAATTPSRRTPVTYAVQSGDTLSAIAQAHDISIEQLAAANDIADPNLLQIGQILIIPQGELDNLDATGPTEMPIEASGAEDHENPQLPMLTPSGPPLVEISEAAGVGSLEAEVVVLRNEGGAVNLEGWTLSSGTDEAFVLPALTLFTEGEVRVHSADGDDTPRNLHWRRTEPAWQTGEMVALRDAEGRIVDTYVIPEP
ncbi:MAG: LysM peptidoglycan-binding domain-containing protein, partial [Anaerolineae bacterium]